MCVFHGIRLPFLHPTKLQKIIELCKLFRQKMLVKSIIKRACFVPPMAKAACTLSILPVRYIAGDPCALGRRGGYQGQM